MDAPPLVIAHRGASGSRPEHTRSAFRLAVEQGADAVEIDVVASKDGVPVVRHEPELSGTTDVAARPEFADRRRTAELDGRSVRGWFTEDFTWAELRTLRARERMPRLRPGSAAFDGREALLRLDDVIALTADAGIGLVVELKHAARSARLGLPLDALLVDALSRAAAAPAVTVESFEPEVLRALAAGGFAHPLVRLLDRRSLREAAAVEGVAGISVPTWAARPALVAAAARRGLEVWTWTLRPENRFLPWRHRRPGGPARFGRYEPYWRSLAAAGVTGVFADHPDLARAALGRAGAVGPRA